VSARKPVVPLPEWVIALVAAIEESEGCRRAPQFLALVPEHVRQTARRWAA
jgi:hypothetical protein